MTVTATELPAEPQRIPGRTFWVPFPEKKTFYVQLRNFSSGASKCAEEWKQQVTFLVHNMNNRDGREKVLNGKNFAAT